MRPTNRASSDSDDSQSSLSFDLEKQYAAKHQQIMRRRIEQGKKETLQEKKKQKEKQRMLLELDRIKLEQSNKEREQIPAPRQKETDKDEVFDQPKPLDWFIYPKCPELNIKERVPKPMNQLPIFRKKEQIMESITKNQFVLVTGQTGCGKSTQVPRLIYQYLRQIKDQKAKIMCVQPRRIAVMNLHSILDKQMMEEKQIGYQIGMKSEIKPTNRIVFVTNGIFLQRLVHSTEFFEEYPFIVLDQVHERDIDTDFILLTIKRVIRQFPKVRIILMSATIDNHLFRYYFASDHVDKILKEKNYYLRIAEAREQQRKEKQERRMRRSHSDQEEQQSESSSDEQNRLEKKYGFGFLNSKSPCPSINVTEPGKYKREYYYLDTMKRFLPGNVVNNSWGGVIFSDKYPSTNRQLYESVTLIIDELVKRNKDNRNKSSVLIFMPGLAEIEQLSEYIRDFFRAENVQKYMEILNVHSSILNDDISKKLLQKTGSRHKIIIATNIAESSITVLGVEYVIDFCLSKEVRFDQRSRMQNLELVWASKASCNQRAGRTGRVCDGIIFRMVEKKFYDNLKDYSQPEIQRSSLDKLILRIKLLHEGQGKGSNIFAQPGEVLGSAIQPPKLKNIDTAIKSLKFSGGLQDGQKDGEFKLTNLGRLYIDIPIDITYCKLLVVSQLFGTYWDMLTLVSILSQSKDVIRRGTIDRNYRKYYQTCSTPYNCDFLGLLTLFENGKKVWDRQKQSRDDIYLDVYTEIINMKRDIERRIQRKKSLFPMLEYQDNRKWKLRDMKKSFNREMEEYLLRFKMTLVCGFINNMLIVKPESLTEKQEKRLALMKRVGIPSYNTVCLLNAKYLKKPATNQAEDRLKSTWLMHIASACNIPSTSMSFTLTLGLTYLHFKEQDDLHKFLYFRSIEESKKLPYDPDMPNPATKKFVTTQELISSFGQMDHMTAGRATSFHKNQTVLVDNYSLNRVININEGADSKYLITNNVSKQSSRMKAKFASQLPHKSKHLEVLAQLLFYPFVRLSTNFQKSRYDFVLLGKSKKGRLPRTKIPIKFNLTNKDIMEANQIRIILRKYLSLNDPNLQQFKGFWTKVDTFLYVERQNIVESEKWQGAYMDQVKAEKPEMGYILKQLFESQGQHTSMVSEKGEDLVFMNEIRAMNLKYNYFSDITIAGMTLQQRQRNYNLWKYNKLREVRAIESRIYDTNSYLACGEKSCAMRICPMVKVGPINQIIYRQLFGYIEDNVKQLPFNVSDPNHFCNMLQSNYLEWQFTTWGCANGHYFAIKFQHENKLRIVPFSELLIIYPDGSSDRADFKNLDIKHWKKNHDKKLMDKYKIAISTYCFVCDEILTSFKLLEQHIRESKHTSNMRQFMRTLPQEMQEKPKVIKDIEDDGSGY